MCNILGYSTSFFIASDPDPLSCWHSLPDIKPINVYIIGVIQGCLYFMLYPLVGWIADTKVGRSKIIKFSVWCCWFGTLIQMISLCIQYSTCGGLLVSISKYGLSLVALLLLMTGTASYQTNILAYGLDQLHEYSNSHIRAFVHWIVWAQFVGFNVSYIAFDHNTMYDSRLILITGIVIFTAISIAVVVSSICDNKFERTGVLVNSPYSLIYNVLKYAKQHKYAVNRSSLTYWKNKTPSRIDFGKTSFGGPFSEDEVEAVKTFLKIVLVFLSSFGFHIPHYILVYGALQFVNMFEGSQTDVNGYGSFILWNAFNKSILLIVPLLEVVVLPLYSKIEYFILSPLKCIALAYVFVLLTLISMLILDIVGHYITSIDNDICFVSGNNALHMSYYFYSIPFLFSGLAIAIAYISFLEFICSQAPVNMSGMLTGVYFLIRGIYTSVGPSVEVMLKNIYIKTFTCTFWILLVQTIICIVGICVFLFVLKWYSQRRRSEEYYPAKAIEEKYDNYFRMQADLETSNSSTVIISSL